MDGAVAREMKIQSRRGDFLDHAVDRYADIFIITGIFAGGLVPWQIGVFALTGVLMASYLGTQAQAVGVGPVLRRDPWQGGPARDDPGGRHHRPARSQ
jgi:archaetidylinositol phosphate synthase